MSTKKNFIIDTNVILHDYSFMDNFEENDIYIPFVVLEELDISSILMQEHLSANWIQSLMKSCLKKVQVWEKAGADYIL